MSVAIRWAALKRAVQQEASRVLEEYSKARESILAQCGQDIARGRVKLSLGRSPAGWPEVYIQPEQLLVDPAPAACAVTVAGVAPIGLAEHWPGSLRRWEEALSMLIATNADTIVSAWEKSEEAKG
jgi:hypothetical protein